MSILYKKVYNTVIFFNILLLLGNKFLDQNTYIFK